MTNQKGESYRDLWMLGAVITVPLILLSGPFAGYLVGHFLLVGYFDLPQYCVGICVGLGIIGSGLQIVRIIQRIREFDSNKKS